jgi:hypothetical protein
MKNESGHDPYFNDRLDQATKHRVLRRFEFGAAKVETVESNKQLAHPYIEGTPESLGWSKRSVDNIMNAYERGWIDVQVEGENIRIELLPIESLPEQLGQVTEWSRVQENIASQDGVFGDQSDQTMTYLQTVDFAVEGYMDDEREGKRYGRVYVDSSRLKEKRNVYLDPESLAETDYEYGFAFVVYGGIPKNAIDHIDLIQAKKVRFEIDTDDDNWPSQQEVEQEMERQIDRLKTFIQSVASYENDL